MHPARRRRLDMALTQSELARRGCGIPRQRINDYEAGRRTLGEDALAKLKHELQLQLLVSPDNCLTDAQVVSMRTHYPWEVHVDPGTTWATIPAKYAKYYRHLKLHNRPPLEFRSLVRCDSALEALVCDYLFEQGAKPLFSNPLALGFRDYPLLDLHGQGYGLALRATFRLAIRGRDVLWWPQVSFLANGLIHRADALLLDVTADSKRWFFLEIDGDAHLHSEWDVKRDEELSLFVLRFGYPTVLNFVLLDLLRQQLENL